MSYTCERCKKIFEIDWRKGKQVSPPKFCSRSCANARAQTEEMNQSRRLKLSKEKVFCKACGIEILRGRKLGYCKKCVSKSDEYRALVSQSLKGKAGGYRTGSGRSKSGYYQGIYCGSQYELAWVIYQIDHRLPFRRFPGMLQYKEEKYIPDFIQNGIIIEIKGYHTDSVDKQIRVAKANNFDIILKYGKDLVNEFSYVKDKYNISLTDLYTLYDSYKPRYTKVCKCCKRVFETDYKNRQFCSRSCSGKSHSILRSHK